MEKFWEGCNYDEPSESIEEALKYHILRGEAQKKPPLQTQMLYLVFI